MDTAVNGHAPTSPAALETSVSAMLEVIAWEIELSAARTMALDDVMSRAMERLPAEERNDLLEGFHTIDLLTQQLMGLSTFVRRMSESVDEQYAAPVSVALNEITLGALADRMRSALGGEEKGIQDGDGAGDLDLF